MEEWAAPNEAVQPVSAGPLGLAPLDRAWQGVAGAGPLQIRIPHGPIPRLAPEPKAAGASQARVAGDSITAPLRPAIQAPPSEEVHAAVPAPELLPLHPPLSHGPVVAPATTVPVPAVARAEKAACLVPQLPWPSQDHDTVDWLATLIWLAVLAIDGRLALAEVLQKLPPGPVQRQSGTLNSRSRPSVLGFGHPRPRQILES